MTAYMVLDAFKAPIFWTLRVSPDLTRKAFRDSGYPPLHCSIARVVIKVDMDNVYTLLDGDST